MADTQSKPVVQFRCNTLKCEEIATWARTMLICGEYVVDDPMCEAHKVDTGLSAIEGDVRPIETAVVDLTGWPVKDIESLVITQ